MNNRFHDLGISYHAATVRETSISGNTIALSDEAQCRSILRPSSIGKEGNCLSLLVSGIIAGVNGGKTRYVLGTLNFKMYALFQLVNGEPGALPEAGLTTFNISLPQYFEEAQKAKFCGGWRQQSGRDDGETKA